MKIIGPVILLGILAISSLFFAFTDSSESDFLNQIKESNKVIANQSACIDDIEASLYDFSYEISHLRIQNEFLIQENENLRGELKKQAIRAAAYRSEIVAFEEETYNLKRQLEQVLIGREIRARHEANNAELIIADTPVNETNIAEEEQIIDLQAQINSIETEIKEREEAIQEISEETQEVIASIEANEAKVDFNINLEPASDPSIDLHDPLVSNDVLYDAPIENGPKFFTSIELVDNEDENIAATSENDILTSKSPIYSLIENTAVTYNYIACRNDRYGKKIKKLKKGAKNWKYTFIDFNLEAENINLLLNKEFRLRVLSTDLNTYVKFTTKEQRNSSYYDFIYEGEPLKISFFNQDVKGNSFDIQIFHIIDGEEYLLENAQKQLFLDGLNTQNDLATRL